MRVRLYWLLNFALLVFIGCETSEDATFKPAIVVQGYLYANEPLDTITLRQSLPLNAPENDSYLSGALVTISDSLATYTLVESDTAHFKGRYGSKTPIIIRPGVTYNLRVEALGQVVTSETTVPDTIHLDSVRFNGKQLSLTDIDTVQFPIDDSKLTDPGIELAWSASKTASSYGVEAISLDTTAPTVDIQLNQNLPDSTSIGRYRFFITSTKEQLSWYQFRRYGLNAIRALAIDKNYQDFIFGLYLSGTQINNGTLHVTGGLGVFASAARATKNIYLKGRPK